MITVPPILAHGFRALAVCAGAVALGMAVWYAPIDAQMGPVQKLVYLHIPVAIASFFCALGVFVASIATLWSRDDRWDESARIAAVCAVVCSAIVLITGMIWGQMFWGFWWTWSPRLTFTLVMFLVYLGYLIVRSRIADPGRRAVTAAVYGLVAFLDVPLLYLSARLLPDVHPTSLPLTDPMRTTMAVCLFATAMALVWAIAMPWIRIGRAGADDSQVRAPRSGHRHA